MKNLKGTGLQGLYKYLSEVGLSTIGLLFKEIFKSNSSFMMEKILSCIKKYTKTYKTS